MYIYLRFLRKNNFFIRKEQYENNYPSGSQFARLNCSRKTHELNSESDKLTFPPIF